MFEQKCLLCNDLGSSQFWIATRHQTCDDLVQQLKCPLQTKLAKHVLSSLSLPSLDVKNNDVVPWVLKTILARYIPSQNPHVRQAACIWLLSLVKKLGQHKEITVGVFCNAMYF